MSEWRWRTVSRGSTQIIRSGLPLVGDESGRPPFHLMASDPRWNLLRRPDIWPFDRVFATGDVLE